MSTKSRLDHKEIVIILLASLVLAQVSQWTDLPQSSIRAGSRRCMPSRMVVTTGVSGPGTDACAVGRKTTSGRARVVLRAMPPKSHARRCAADQLSLTESSGEAKPLPSQRSPLGEKPRNPMSALVLSEIFRHWESRFER